jgi:uncharacterized protein with HEPN domain
MNKVGRVADYVGHILQAMARIERHTSGVDAAGFAASELVQDAVVRNLEVIGEAANNIQRVDPAFSAAHSEVPWAVMYAMRNRLTHGYDTVDLDIVWKVVERDLPVLKPLIAALPH